MIDTDALRKKYATRMSARPGRLWSPAGSADVLALCYYADGLLELVRQLQYEAKPDMQNHVEMRLSRLRGRKG